LGLNTTAGHVQHGFQHSSSCYRSKYHQVNSNNNQTRPWNTILIQHLKTTKQQQTWEFSGAWLCSIQQQSNMFIMQSNSHHQLELEQHGKQTWHWYKFVYATSSSYSIN
jgi:hypothetical protein